MYLKMSEGWKDRGAISGQAYGVDKESYWTKT